MVLRSLVMRGSQWNRRRPQLARCGVAILIAAAVVASAAMAQEQGKPAPSEAKQKTRTLKTKRATYKITTRPKEVDSDKAEEAEIAEARKTVEFPGESYAGTDRK